MNTMAAHILNDGDEIVTDADPGALYTVVAVHADKAWIRAVHGDGEMIVDHRQCWPVGLPN